MILNEAELKALMESGKPFFPRHVRALLGFDESDRSVCIANGQRFIECPEDKPIVLQPGDEIECVPRASTNKGSIAFFPELRG